MNDTSPEIAALVRERLMRLSGEVRMQMGSDMFEAAKEMVLASFPNGLSPIERKRMLYERVYGEKPPF
ncbi:MAG TPA: hypothetical protein VF773_00865 [Verrucomicrobiae bacterium]